MAPSIFNFIGSAPVASSSAPKSKTLAIFQMELFLPRVERSYSRIEKQINLAVFVELVGPKRNPIGWSCAGKIVFGEIRAVVRGESSAVIDVTGPCNPHGEAYLRRQALRRHLRRLQ